MMRAESTSSIGALMKIDVVSMISITGGIGSPGGDGVVYSPSSIDSSDTTPPNGARSTVLRSSLSIRPIAARALAIIASAASQDAAEVWARLSS